MMASFKSLFQRVLLLSSVVNGLVLDSSVSGSVERFAGRSIDLRIQQGLAAIISNTSTILNQNDPTWREDTERYMQNVQPQVQLVVRPGSEEDVAKIVRYANTYNIPFYAVSRGHALTSSVRRFNGIEIDLRYLNKVTINSDKKTAHFQGGAFSNEVIAQLWKQGYVTATGGCSCVSVIGPALGGGHGLQQGKHGLTMDHFVNLNVVLANGTSITVNKNKNTDLWWAFRGAGHNFGIVTSYDSKIWPDNFKTYFVKSYQFDGSSHDAIIKEVNKFQGNGTLDPRWLASFGYYGINRTFSSTKATIFWTFLYDGPSAEAERVLKPFDRLRPLSIDRVRVPYSTINDQVGGNINGSLCEPNKTHIIGTAGLQTYNVTSMRAIYDLYNKKIKQQPRLWETRVLVEGYSVKGVKDFKSEDSAYPLRDDYILTYFDARFNSTDDPLISFASKWRDEVVTLWNAGQPARRPTAYVNYAAGYESAEAMYGYEPWRLEKLRKLKKQYDPLNKFAWYNPINRP